MNAERDAARVWVGALGKAYGYGRVDPWLIVAQAILETGDFTSAIYHENNNLFGLKRPRVRPTTAIGENRGHAVYRDRSDGIKDYFLRQAYFGIPNTSNAREYVNATVQSGYAEATRYGPTWLDIYEQMPKRTNPLPLLVVGVIAASWING